MSQHSDEERQAGKLILSQLKMFNEAVVYFEQHLIPAFWKGFDQCVERFIKDNNWAGKSNYEHQEYCWLAHPGWVIEGVNCKCWFENSSTVSRRDDYVLAVLTGTGTVQGKFGFEFKLDGGYFGGVKKIASYANNLQQSCREELHRLELEDHGKGNYFIPVTIDPGVLAECWADFGEFPPEHEVFSPLRAVLDKLLQSTETLDAIFLSEDLVSES